jgi:hypothetical protein
VIPATPTPPAAPAAPVAPAPPAAAPPPATTPAPSPSKTQYLLVYAEDGKHFLFAGKTYDKAALVIALTAASTPNKVHIIVLRDDGQGLTLGDFLAVVPALQNGQSCLFFQDASGPMKSASVQDDNGKPVDESFCPKFGEVAAKVGPWAPPSAAPPH